MMPRNTLRKDLDRHLAHMDWGEIPSFIAQRAASAIIIIRNTHKARHIAALLVPVSRVNEGGAVWLIKDWALRPLVRRRPLP